MSGFYRCFCDGIGNDDNVVYFDMDGTIADLYAVDGWLDMLESFDPYPYANAACMFDYDQICGFVDDLHNIGWKVGVVSWLSKCSDDDYDEAVIEAKLDWLDRFFPPVDEILIIPYGEPKYEAVISEEAILIDDEPLNRMHWDSSGPLRRSYPANELDALADLLRASVVDSIASEIGFYESEIVTIEELVNVAYKRMIFSIGNSDEYPLIEYFQEGSNCGIVFLNSTGTAYYSPYIECVVSIADPYCVTQQEIGQVFAKIDRLVYDTT